MLSSKGSVPCFAGATSSQIFTFSLFCKCRFTRGAIRKLQAEKELKNLLDNTTNIFKISILDRYMNRINQLFCCEKYSLLVSICYIELISCSTLIYNPKEADKNADYQTVALPDSLIEGNHSCCNYPKIVKLLNSNDKMSCSKLSRSLRYHARNKHQDLVKYFHLTSPYFTHSDQKMSYLAEPHSHIKINIPKMV